MIRERGAANMRHLFVWIVEFIKLVGGRRLHPLSYVESHERNTVRRAHRPVTWRAL